MEIEEFDRFFRLGHAREAHRLVGLALKSGALVRLPCQVCNSSHRVQAHHRDYSKPLKVVWLCQPHHGFATTIERLLPRCKQAVDLAVEGGFLWELAEVFTSELTNLSTRNPQLKYRDPMLLCQEVEKLLRLLLLDVVIKEQKQSA
jgi:hypothetical protein